MKCLAKRDETDDTTGVSNEEKAGYIKIVNANKLWQQLKITR